jgi:hypothetical protein
MIVLNATKENQVITLTESDKTLYQNSKSFLVKNPQKARNRSMITQHNKIYIGETYGQHYTEWRKTKSISWGGEER